MGPTIGPSRRGRGAVRGPRAHPPKNDGALGKISPAHFRPTSHAHSASSRGSSPVLRNNGAPSMTLHPLSPCLLPPCATPIAFLLQLPPPPPLPPSRFAGQGTCPLSLHRRPRHAFIAGHGKHWGQGLSLSRYRSLSLSPPSPPPAATRIGNTDTVRMADSLEPRTSTTLFRATRSPSSTRTGCSTFCILYPPDTDFPRRFVLADRRL